MLASVQLSQVLSLLDLDGATVELNKLVLGERDDLVAILGRQLDHWVAQHGQRRQSDQGHQHWRHVLLKVPDFVVI